MCDLKQYGDLVRCKECTRFWTTAQLATMTCPYEIAAPRPSPLVKAVLMVAAAVALWLVGWRLGEFFGWW